MTSIRPIVLSFCAALVAACAEEAPPRTVTEFMDDQLLLEAVLLRCTENRAESRYDAECVNAREAVKLLEAKAAADQRAELEALSERKREALRRTQQAAAEARRRAAEAEQRRAELEYQAQFGLPPPDAGSANPDAMPGNFPLAVIPDAGAGPVDDAVAGAGDAAAVSLTPQGNVPVADVPPAPVAEEGVDLDSIRKEMRRRKEEEQAGP